MGTRWPQREPADERPISLERARLRHAVPPRTRKIADLSRAASRSAFALVIALLLAVSAFPASPVGAATITLNVSNDAFSPNGDGILDTTTAVIHVDSAATLTLVVLDPDGGFVDTVASGVALDPGVTRITWTGIDDRGRSVPDGAYTMRATATDPSGVTSSAEIPTRVDTVRPRFAWRDVRPNRVVRTDQDVTFSFTTRGARIARLIVADASGRVVFRDEQSELGGEVTLTWTGRSLDGGRVLPGLYQATVTIRDTAGNIRTSRPALVRYEPPVRSHVVTSVKGAGNRVALTFDDCGSASAWARILSILDDADLEGTFFCPGQRVLAEPALARRTVVQGHSVGGHGWDHADLTTLGVGAIRDRLERDDEAWWRVAHALAVPYVRPPYGATNEMVRSVAGSIGYAWIVLWDVDPRDWERPGAATIASRVLRQIRAGSIVVLHVQDQTADALPMILRGLERRGLEQVSLADLLQDADVIRSAEVERRPV